MIAILKPCSTLKDKAAVVRMIERAGYLVMTRELGDECRVSILGDGDEGLRDRLSELPGVARVELGGPGYQRVSSLQTGRTSQVRVGDCLFGGVEFGVIAGPCAVESEDQILTVAEGVQAAGACALRGGAFKPRTSPYSFQGLGVEGLELLARARAARGLPVVTEVMAVSQVETVSQMADVLQIGARNMQNFDLLRAVGQQVRPVLLKRGMAATLDELLFAAEYVVSSGNPNVILCERGIRTFGTDTRNTLDIAAIPVLKRRTHLPVLIDPSHACGLSEVVPALSRAALAVGADGIIVEVHPQPDQAWSDGRQSLTLPAFRELMADLRRIAPTMGRAIRDSNLRPLRTVNA